MKISFSTRGWSGYTWADLVEKACEMHFAGIEVYNALAQGGMVESGGPFHKYSLVKSLRELREKHLTIPCFDSSYDVSVSDSGMLENVRRLIRLAADMHTPYVCVWVKDNRPEAVRQNLSTLVSEAASCNVTILIKTSGLYADTALLRNLLNFFACDQLAVLWDVHHPYRDHGETPAQSIKNLGAYVRHIHLRDSDDAQTYNLIGEGTFPIKEVMDALRSIDYDGFISMEWKPEWMDDLTDMDVIMPHFVNFMERFERSRDLKVKLYPNYDGSGFYVWKKDELIDLTFSQVLDRMADEFPDQYCFKYTTLDYTRTYSEFRDDVNDFARALVSLGVRPGSKVSVWATNVPAWYITFWATVKIGAVLVTVNTAYKSHEAEYLLQQSDTHTLVMIEKSLDSDYRGIINELCPEIKDSVPGDPLHCKRLPFLRNVITVGYR
ncbi:MAG: AMP-binding protein, partial [Bacteroidales bacterium]|nr:AMP-binding protein [Bacteroidales bacterium]